MSDLTKTLQHLASRLERIGGDELAAAAELVRTALSVDLLMRPEAEHALFSDIWGHVTRALDHEDIALLHFDEVNALESEMAGHVLSYRLTRGWLVRAAAAPTEFPPFSEVVDKLQRRVG